MTAPRFTLDTLQNIRFPADPDTPAEYTYTSGGGQTATLSRVIYTLVGLAAVWCISLLFRERELTEEGV